MQLRNYQSYSSRYTWTGRYTRNQMWSYFRVDEPILVSSIDVYWGGYDRSTKGRHFIAKYENGSLGDLVVRSGEISVPQGRGWRRADVRETLLQPGQYAVGIWGDYLGRRIVGTWVDNEGLIVYTDTNTRLKDNITGDRWRAKGVIPARLNGNEPSSVYVKSNGIWRKGEPYVKVNSSWRKGEVWVKSNGIWRKGQ